MRSLTFSGAAVNAKATAMRVIFRDGRVLLFDGERPSSPEEKVSTQTCLAILDIKSIEYGEQDGVLEFTMPEATPALASGTPTWFRIESANRRPIVDGLCGPYGDMLVEGDVEADGEVRVTRMIYREKKAY